VTTVRARGQHFAGADNCVPVVAAEDPEHSEEQVGKCGGGASGVPGFPSKLAYQRLRLHPALICCPEVASVAVVRVTSDVTPSEA
jgi:hypothetical protein